jgi:hypothetical protein
VKNVAFKEPRNSSQFLLAATLPWSLALGEEHLLWGYREQGAEENILTEEGRNNRRLEKTAL